MRFFLFVFCLVAISCSTQTPISVTEKDLEQKHHTQTKTQDPLSMLGNLKSGPIEDYFGIPNVGIERKARGCGDIGEGTVGRCEYKDEINRFCIRVRSGALMLKGAMSRDVVRRIISRHINEVKFCYETELIKQPNLTGRLVLKFIVASTGDVSMVMIKSSTLDNSTVENCITDAVKRWSFPQPKDNRNVIISYPFILTVQKDCP